ncbi:MAG: heme-copper oxidase subunit III [Thermodesulfobacteriota bacterium]
MSEHAHELEWETSPWPLIVCVGILLFAPLAFSFHFVYQKPAATIVCLALGGGLILISVIGWVKDGLEDKHGWGQGLSFPAMPFFILAEALIFLALFASYWVIRLGSPSWPPAGTPHISLVTPIIMTVILVSSSVTIHLAEMRHEADDNAGFLTWLIITIILGCIFFGITINEWTHLIHEGFDTTTNAYSTIFYSITGLHASHVLIGVLIFVCILIPALVRKTNHTFIKTASLYWHFVDIVWFFVASQVYFWT